MVLAVVIERDPVTLVDDEQRKRPVEGSQIARYRLHRAKHHLGARLLASEPSGEDVGLEPPRLVLGVVLLHQLLDVGQHQHPTARLAGQLGDHQTLAGPGGQHHHGGIRVLTKVADHGVDGVGLIGSEDEHAGLGYRYGVVQDGAIIGILAPKTAGRHGAGPLAMTSSLSGRGRRSSSSWPCAAAPCASPRHGGSAWCRWRLGRWPRRSPDTWPTRGR